MVHWPRRWRRAASSSAAAAPTKKKAPPPPSAAQSSFSAAPFVYLAAGAAAPALLRFVPEEYSREASSAVLPPPPPLLPSDGELSPGGARTPLLEAPAFGATASGGKKRSGGLRLSMVVHHVVMAVVPAPAAPVPTAAAAGGGGGCSCLVSRLLRSRRPQQATIVVAVLTGLVAMAAFASTNGGRGRAMMRLAAMLLAAAFLAVLAFWLSLGPLAAWRRHRQRQLGDRPSTAAPAAASGEADEDDDDRKLATLSRVNVASSHELAGTRGGRHSGDSEAPSVYVCRSLPISPLMRPVAAIRGVDAGGSHTSDGDAGTQLGGSVSASLPASPTTATSGCLSWQRSAALYSRSYDRPLLRPVTPPSLNLAGSPTSQAAVAAAAKDDASGSSGSPSDNADNTPELAASSATVAMSAMENAAAGAVDMPPNVLVRTSSDPDVHRTPVVRHHRGFRRLFRPSSRSVLAVADRSASLRSSIAASATASAAAGSGGESSLPSSPMATRSAPSSPAVRRWSRHAAAAAAAGPPPAAARTATHFYQSRRAAAVAAAASAEELASPMAMVGERRHSVASAATRLQEGFVLPAAGSVASPSAVSAKSPAAAPATIATAEPPPRQSRSGMALALTLVVVLSALFLGRIPAVAAAVCVIVLASRVRGAEPLSSPPPPADGDVAPSPEKQQRLAGPGDATIGAGRGKRRLQAVPEGHHSEGSSLRSRFRSPIADILQHSHTTDPLKQAVLAGLLSREQHGPAAGPAAAAYLR
eukprot:SM000366S13820  [mRNA]  locus=s366:18070:20600:- [translate_table: standard]